MHVQYKLEVTHFNGRLECREKPPQVRIHCSLIEPNGMFVPATLVPLATSC